MTYLPPKFGASNIGNTSGVTGTVNRGIVFAGGNNVTLSQNVNASSATITISAANQSVQTQNLHNVTLSGNTAGAMAQVSSGTLTLAGGNNITLSQNGNAVSIIGGAAGGIALANSQTTYSSGTAHLSVVGGALTIASTTGQSFNFSAPAQSNLSATGAVSISNNGNTISIGAPAYSAGMSNIGNTSGTSGTVSNRLIFVGGNNITLSQSTGAGGNTLTISAPNQSNQNISLYALGNTTQNSSSLLNASNLSLNGLGAATVGYSNGSIQISAPVQTNQSLGFYAAGNTTGQSSSSTFDARTVSFQGAGNVSVGYSNGSVLVSGGTAAPSPVAISAGTTSASLNNIVFSNSNGVSFGLNGSTITASAAGGAGGGIALANSQTTYTSGTANLVASGALTIASTTGQSFNLSVPQTSSLSASGAMSIITNGNTISFGAGSTFSQYDPSPNALAVMATNGQSLHLQPVQAPSFQHDRAYLPVQVSNNNASVGSATITAWVGLYTRNVSTLSLASSSSASVGITYSGTTNNSTYAGIRNMSIGWTNTVPANDYWIGVVSRTTSGGQNASISQMLVSQINSSFSGDFGVAANATNQLKLGLGYYSATTAGMPSSIGFSEINGSAPGALRPPIVRFVSQTA